MNQTGFVYLGSSIFTLDTTKSIKALHRLMLMAFSLARTEFCFSVDAIEPSWHWKELTEAVLTTG